RGDGDGHAPGAAGGSLGVLHNDRTYLPSDLSQPEGHAHTTLGPQRRSAGDVVTKAHVSKGVFAVDWLLFAPTLGTSLLIDWATGKRHAYDAIEVDKYFPTPMAAQSTAQQNPQR